MASESEHMNENDTGACGASSDDPERTGNTVEIPELAAPANEFSTKTWKEDLILYVEGKQLYVSSNILALTSPVLTSTFEEAFKTEGPRELELPGKYDDFVEFLRSFYPGIMKPITNKNVMAVAPLAYQYQVENVQKRCEQFLIDAVLKGISPEGFSIVAQLASSCQMVDLRQKCAEELTRRDDPQLETAVNKLEIAPDFKLEIRDRKIAQLKNDMASLKQSFAEKSDRCAVLENSITQVWSQSLKIGNLETVALGYIDVNIPDDCRTIRKSTSIRNISWTVQANIEKKCVVSYTKEKVDCLSVCIIATGKTSMGQWKCKAHASCSVAYGTTRLWDQLSDDTMRSRQLMFDFGKLRNFKISNTQGLKISVCILVGDILI